MSSGILKKNDAEFLKDARWKTYAASPRDHRSQCSSGSHPDLPDHLELPEGWFTGCDDLEQLWYQVVKELTDPEYRNRTHGNRRTHEAGCSGVLCKKATREHSRRRFGSAPSEKYRLIDPILDFFKEDAEYQIKLWDTQVRRALSIYF